MKPGIISVSLMLALTACFHDSDDVVYQKPFIEVITVSGLTVTLDGTLARPCATRSLAEGGNDYLVTESISGTAGVMKKLSYPSINGSCTGTESTDLVIEVTFKEGAVMAITGWLDLGDMPVSPPQAQDGSGPLSNTESVTSLTLTIDSVTPADPGLPVGTEVSAFYVVDDTVPAAPVLYGVSDSDKQKAYNVQLTLQ